MEIIGVCVCVRACLCVDASPGLAGASVTDVLLDTMAFLTVYRVTVPRVA